MATILARPAATRLSRTPAFWLVGAAILVMMLAASAPSPIYVVYQARFGFSATLLTVIFAVYAVALLASLLLFGSLSDQIGRRPVLADLQPDHPSSLGPLLNSAAPPSLGGRSSVPCPR